MRQFTPGTIPVNAHGRHRASKAFEAHELRRIPIMQTPEARQVIGASSSQGRLLPQALSELFGMLPDVESITLDYTEAGEQSSLSITLLPTDTSIPPFSLSLLASDLSVLGPDRHPTFDALSRVQELVGQYQEQVQRQQGQAGGVK